MPPIGIGIGIGFGNAMGKEARKAAQIPVPGAVVIAPLTESVRNYGSIGGLFTAVGAPVIGANGATFDGVDDRLYIVHGEPTDFTLVLKCKTNLSTAYAPFCVAAATLGSGLSRGWGLFTGGLNWTLKNLTTGASATTGVAQNTTQHIWTFKRTSGNTEAYCDGIYKSAVASGTSGTVLMLGGFIELGNPTYQSASTDSNVVLYHSALSAPDQAAVEAYVAAP